MSEASLREGTSGDFLQSQGAKARAHRDNHYLPLRKGAPTPAEIAATEKALQVLLGSLRSSACGPEMLRAGLTVRLMLDLGRNEEQLSRLYRTHLGGSDTARPDQRGLVSWEEDNKLRCGWWLPAGVHIDRNGPDYAHSIRGDVWLPLLERTALWLDVGKLIDDRQPRPLLGGSSTELESDVETVRDWAKETLGPLGRAVPKAGKLMKAVTEQLAWHPTGDRTLAMQLTGRDMEHSNARSYYTSVSVPKAAKHYATAMRCPISDLSLAHSADRDSTNVLALPAFAQSALTRKAPRGTLEIASAASNYPALKPDNRASDAALVKTHNKMVAKTWIALALATAARGITNVVPGLQRIEPRTGGLFVLDKRGASERPEDEADLPAGAQIRSRTRLVFLNAPVRKMISQYRDHLTKLAGRSNLDAKSKALIRKHIERLEGPALQPFLILSQGTGKGSPPLRASETTASWIENELGESLPPHSNFARHSLRSGLVGDLPASVIDALLGHCDHGTEPWGRGSALDPAGYRALVSVIYEAYFAEGAKFQGSLETGLQEAF